MRVGERPAVDGAWAALAASQRLTAPHPRQGTGQPRQQPARRRDRRPQRLKLLAHVRDAHVRVVDALADRAEVLAHVVDRHLLIREALASRVVRIIQAGGNRLHGILQRLRHRGDRDRQLLRLFLQHADIGHHLPLVAALRGGGGHGAADEGCGDRDRHEQSHYASPTWM